MARVVQLTTDGERRAAALEARSWGYPREVTWLELRAARWYRTAEGIGWLIEGAQADHWHLHGIGRPGCPGVLGLEWTRMVREEARRLGAVRVYAPILNTGAPLERLLRRIGWDKRDALGPFLEVR